MAAAIQALIDKIDNVEVLRDEIAAILLVEQASQQALAVTADEDPQLWALRIFTERSNPWAEFVDSPNQLAATPIVNVSVDNINYDLAASNVVERQRAAAVYHIDCYGYGVSADVPDAGHVVGDAKASLEALRAVRLVRNILMASVYTYLGKRGFVARRWIQSIQMLQPSQDGQQMQHVVAARISFEVLFNEFSPQYVGEALELVSIQVERSTSGEIYFTQEFESSEP